MSYSFFNPPDDPLALQANGLPLYGMGLLPATPEERRSLPRVYSVVNKIPRSQWTKKISTRYSRPFKVLNQGQHGSCVGHGTMSAANKIWIAGGGAPHVFSACFNYGNINGNRDAGASIVAAFHSLQKDGACFEEQVPEGMIYRSQFPKEAFETAKRFMGWPGFIAHDLDEWVSGVLQGGQGVMGVTVGGAFQAYRGQGLVKVGYGPANHCVCEDGFDPTSELIVDLLNSWDLVWGDQGHGRIALDSIARDELYVLFAPPIDPQETELPPKVHVA